MSDLLLPRTDAGVAAQLILVLVLGGVALFAARRHREWRLVVIGSMMLALGLVGVRALH
jgi:hypothetical protein